MIRLGCGDLATSSSAVSSPADAVVPPCGVKDSMICFFFALSSGSRTVLITSPVSSNVAIASDELGSESRRGPRFALASASF